MNSIIKKIVCFWKVKQRKKKILQTFLKAYNLKLIVNRETSIVLSCLTPTLNKKTGKHDLVADDGTVLDRDLSISEATKKIEEYKKIAKRNNISIQEHLDDIAENIKRIKLRKAALTRWSDKFELKFHDHFDGEIVVGKASRRDNTPTLWIQGAHNHIINGKVINIKTIRDPQGVTFFNLPDDVPFRANVEYIFNNRVIPKKNTSSFFPKNWDITRIKEEIAIVYDDLVKSGKDFTKPPFKYKSMNSENTFQILIEFDRLGNLTNAYPLI